MDGEARLGSAFDVHGPRDAERHAEDKPVEIAHGVGRAREEEEQAIVRVGGDGCFAPASIGCCPDALSIGCDEAQVLDHEVVFAQVAGGARFIKIAPEKRRS